MKNNTSTTNLPQNSTPTDSSTKMKQFFDTYYNQPIAFPAGESDAVIGFFTTRGYELSAANALTATLLKQAHSETPPVGVFQLLDKLKGLNQVQLNQVIIEILNYNRVPISILGNRIDQDSFNQYELRNIRA
jgi:hypothetical protein